MSGVEYSESIETLVAGDLAPFFVGWPNPPGVEHRLAILQAASEVIVARASDGVVGFVTAITDGTFAAFLPLLEVRSDAQGLGIGSELVNRMLVRLRTCYSIDLVCDDDVVPFYERLGGTRLTGVAWRNPAGLQT
jgi:ribosomal protein S18 acetylase RimI-like enzyme